MMRKPLILLLSIFQLLHLPIHAQEATDNKYILTFFGGRRTPHHRYSHDGHASHHHGPLVASSSNVVEAAADLTASTTSSPAPDDGTETPVPSSSPSPPAAALHLTPRPLLGLMTFSVTLKDGSRLDEVGGSQRIEPLGRLSEYVISLPATASLDDIASVIIQYSTNSTKKNKVVRMAKIWITRITPDFGRAQFNVPDDAVNDLLIPDTEFVMHRGCKILDKDADSELVTMLSGSGYLCEDVKIENPVHEDESADWEEFFKPHPVAAA